MTWAKGDLETAAARFEDALALAQEAVDQFNEENAHFGLGRVAFARGDSDRAREYLVKALSSCFAYSIYSWDFPYVLEALAYVAMSQQQMVQAARLLGVTQAYHERFQRLRTSKEREMRDSAIIQVRAVRGDKAFAAARQEGEGMGLKEAVVYARQG